MDHIATSRTAFNLKQGARAELRKLACPYAPAAVPRAAPLHRGPASRRADAAARRAFRFNCSAAEAAPRLAATEMAIVAAST